MGGGLRSLEAWLCGFQGRGSGSGGLAGDEVAVGLREGGCVGEGGGWDGWEEGENSVTRRAEEWRGIGEEERRRRLE